MMKYIIHKTEAKPSFAGEWDSPIWRQAETLQVEHFHPQSSNHHPQTQAKVLYDDNNLYVLFRVDDQYVRAVHTGYQELVCQDSCVEFFVQPDPHKGYLNFEINCIGTMLLYYIEDATRTADGFEKYTSVPKELTQNMTMFHSIPGPITEEITTPMTWYLEYNIPFALLEAYLVPLHQAAGTTWRGNFFKCADHCSHPHWVSWSPIGEALNFHQPKYFGILEFGL
ncbi:hypothetical protein U27_05316 [Candidatus Vecturithrix granuli]|uniref:Carbohydrate-binding domain-containing protein n=1 Tax=Vecturithrix granuli TaxID=1499967 RepID=A0A081C187_VECG1|nr:hypothetical protein U27_05316 [Candidatus Vecturithrix granuli]